MFEGNFIAGINTPEGIATYHIKQQYWKLFEEENYITPLKLNYLVYLLSSEYYI